MAGLGEGGVGVGGAEEGRDEETVPQTQSQLCG